MSRYLASDEDVREREDRDWEYVQYLWDQPESKLRGLFPKKSQIIRASEGTPYDEVVIDNQGFPIAIIEHRARESSCWHYPTIRIPVVKWDTLKKLADELAVFYLVEETKTGDSRMVRLKPSDIFATGDGLRGQKAPWMKKDPVYEIPCDRFDSVV